jgi:hypothetical protein
MPRRLVAGPLAAAVLASLALAVPAGAFVVPFQAPATSGKVYACNNHGLKASGKRVRFTIATIKGGHPTKAQLNCNRAYGVVKTGLAFLGAKAAKSLGKSKRVNGDIYTFDEQPIVKGQRSPSYAWSGASTVIDVSVG